ncbi:MAG TPA: hypothetical protein VN026_01740 [Bacteroidia bacterium]|jgi:hypothetical protein|nr:hypothetical protein [Bacteroidia bacterium]
MNKATAIKTINKLPTTFSIDELIEQFVLADKIERGLLDSDNGKVFSTTQAKKKLSKWLK